MVKLWEGIDEFSKQWTGNLEVILVDDGSTDGSRDLLMQYKNKFINRIKNIHVISQDNTGKGGALQKGISKATMDFILTLDADMATEPVELLNWLEIKKNFDDHEVLIASRDLNTSRVKDSLKRKIVGNVFNFIIRKTVGLEIHDTQCGFKLYPSLVAKKVFAELQTPGWAHDVEILLRVKRMGYTIIEMPVHWEAVPGSKIEVLRDSWNMFWEVMAIRKKRLLK